MEQEKKHNGLHRVLSEMAKEQKVAILILKGGERHHLKVLEITEDLLIGEARCLYHNYEIGRKIHQHAMEEEKRVAIELPNGVSAMTMADAIDRFGTEAHRFKFYIPIDLILSVALDLDDAFDETPFFPGLI